MYSSWNYETNLLETTFFFDDAQEQTMKFHIEDIFDIDRERYENEMFFDPEMNRHINESLKLGPKHLIEEIDNDEILYRKNLFSPKIDIPKSAKKLIRNKGLGYFESSTFYKGKHYANWSIKTEMFPDKITGGGKFLFEEVGNKTRRIVQGEINAKMFGVGEIIERLIIQNLEENYEKITKVTKQWIKEHYSND